MQLKHRINAFAELGNFMRDLSAGNLPEYASILKKAESENGWFTQNNIHFALQNWSASLSKKNLEKWVANYSTELGFRDREKPKTIAVIMAGNIPLVGFHDFISVLITGNKVLAKLSSNDKTLLPMIAEKLIAIDPEFESRIDFSHSKLENFDAVIATGSNNSARYFDFYFGKYPHIIRKNRNSIAVLTGSETEEELRLLADDIFIYFGLGCRNVSKMYVPEDYDFKVFFQAMFEWKEIINNHKYINNYDYNKAVYLMDNFPLLDNEFMLLKEDTALSSPISVVFFERYSNIEGLKNELEAQSEAIQCVVSKAGFAPEIYFGESQRPRLWEYADGIDTVEFLLKLP